MKSLNTAGLFVWIAGLWLGLNSVGLLVHAQQSSLLEWQPTTDLLAPPLSKDRRVLGEAQRDRLYIDVRENPMNATNKVNLAVVYERLGAHRKALELYRDVSADEKFYTVAVSGFVKNLYLSGNIPGTLKLIELADSREGLGWEALLIKGEIHVLKNEFRRALRVMEKAWLAYSKETGRDPVMAQQEKLFLLNNLGFVYQQDGNRRGVADVRALIKQIGG